MAMPEVNFTKPEVIPAFLICCFKEDSNNKKLILKFVRPMANQTQLVKTSDGMVKILDEKATKSPEIKGSFDQKAKIVKQKTVKPSRNQACVNNEDVQILEEKSTKPPALKKKSKKKASRKKKAEITAKPVKEKKIKKKEQSEQQIDLKQTVITSHFQIRRSNRKCKSVLKLEKEKLIMQRLLDKDESGLEVRVLAEKGRGVFAGKEFKRGDLICEYAGELIDYDLGKQREFEYALNPLLGCYSYFFQYQNKKYCVDATKESSRLGRLLNHSKTESNVNTRIFPIKDVPRLIFIAERDIKVGEELLYDYGERDKAAIESHPWLQK